MYVIYSVLFMKQCPNCNYKNNDSDFSCMACGSQLPQQEHNNDYQNQNINQNENQYQNDYEGNGTKKNSNVLGIVSVSTGGVSLLILCCCWQSLTPILAIAAIVTGIIGLKSNSILNKGNKIMSTIGIITGAISIIFTIIIIVMYVTGSWADISEQILGEYYNY